MSSRSSASPTKRTRPSTRRHRSASATRVQAAQAAEQIEIGDIIGCETAKPDVDRKPPPRPVLVRHPRRRTALHDHGHRLRQTVSRTDSPLSTVVVGKWKDGRLGSYRGMKKGYYYSFSRVRHQEGDPSAQATKRLRTGRRRDVRVLQNRQAAGHPRRNDRNLRLHGSRRRQQEGRRQTGHDRRHHRTSRKEIGRATASAGGK